MVCTAIGFVLIKNFLMRFVKIADWVKGFVNNPVNLTLVPGIQVVDREK